MTATVERHDLPGLMLHAPQTSRSARLFVSALLVAALLHLLLIIAVSFVPPTPASDPEAALEVLILSDTGQTTSHPAADAALSQRDRAGESPHGDAAVSNYGDSLETPQTDAPEQAPTQPLTEPTAPAPNPPAEPQTTIARMPVEKTDSVLSAVQEPALDQISATEALSQITPPIDAAQILASRGQEIARLTADLQAKSNAYAKRVRRKSISTSTREFRYASYLGAWARKVERIGNINYPRAAKDQRIYGNLILHVAVRSDGSVERIRVVKSSGYDLLDEAAIGIVELSAPFSPFPPDIAAETDVLDIIRTWQFMRGDGLGWER